MSSPRYTRRASISTKVNDAGDGKQGPGRPKSMAEDLSESPQAQSNKVSRNGSQSSMGSGVVKVSPGGSKTNSVAPSRKTTTTTTVQKRRESLSVQSQALPSFEAGQLITQYLQQVPDTLSIIYATTGLTPLIIDSTGEADLMVKATMEKPYAASTSQTLCLKNVAGPVVVDTKRLHQKVFMEKKITIDDAKVILRDKLLQAIYKGSVLVFEGRDGAFPFKKYYDVNYFPSCIFSESGGKCLKSDVWSKLLESQPKPLPPTDEQGNPTIPQDDYIKNFMPNVEFKVVVTSTFSIADFNDGFLAVSLQMDSFVPIAIKK